MSVTTERGAREELISGSEAVAQALRLADVDVVAAYPIRPYDTVMQYCAKLIANGAWDCDYIVAESEHSQFEITKHASAVGARAFCGSSGVGWMYAMEAIAVTAGLRLPMMALCGNRALDDPGAFGVEHNDALAARDLGWLFYWVENAQEALDMALIGYRVAEDMRVSLPIALCLDGAFLTHAQNIVSIPTQEQVAQFLPPYSLGNRVFHPDNPISIAPQVDQDWLMELRRQTDQGMKNAPAAIEQAHADYQRIFGRQGGEPFIEEFMCDDAEVVLLGMGTLAMPVRVLVRELRKQGEKVGMVRLKWFRPFPTEQLRRSLSRFKAVGVIDRDFSMGSPKGGGVVYNEIRSVLYDLPQRPVVNGYICGLGGREVTEAGTRDMFRRVQRSAQTGQDEVAWIEVRE